jgi:hypothetical protein
VLEELVGPWADCAATAYPRGRPKDEDSELDDEDEDL